jgi:hypothetical protein
VRGSISEKTTLTIEVAPAPDCGPSGRLGLSRALPCLTSMTIRIASQWMANCSSLLRCRGCQATS